MPAVVVGSAIERDSFLYIPNTRTPTHASRLYMFLLEGLALLVERSEPKRNSEYTNTHTRTRTCWAIHTYIYLDIILRRSSEQKNLLFSRSAKVCALTASMLCYVMLFEQLTPTCERSLRM